MLATPIRSKGTHVQGADIWWEQISQDTFKVIVTVYRDCNGVNLLARPVTVRSSGCGTQVVKTTTAYVDDITPVCDAQCTRCLSKSCSFVYGVEKHEQTAIFDLANWRKKGCNQFTFSWEACCRWFTSNYFYIESKAFVDSSALNSSPVIREDPNLLLCLGQNFVHSIAALDKENDSLVYSMTDPLIGAGKKYAWTSPYSSQRPIYFNGFPNSSLPFPKGFHLDSNNGDWKFVPMKEEQSYLTTKIEEYRKGKLIGSVMRDYLVVVVKCPTNSPPVISGKNCTASSVFNLEACAGQEICFRVCTSDTDKDDTVGISWSGGIPNASFKVLNKGSAKRETGLFCWTPNDSDVKSTPYVFVVTASDNAYPIKGQTSQSFRILVKSAPIKGKNRYQHRGLRSVEA